MSSTPAAARPQDVAPAGANDFKRYRDLGYDPIPIIPFDAEISERSVLHARVGTTQDGRGKTPGIKYRDGTWGSFDWVRHATDEQDLERWSRMGAGVGLRLGYDPITDTTLVAIDADTRDKALAKIIYEKVDGHFGRLSVRFGNYPKAIYPIRVKGRFTYRRIEFGEERLEILSDGRQFVAEGIHPTTKKAYEWRRPLPEFAELPVVTADQMAAFLEDARKVLPEASKVKEEGGGDDVSQASLTAPVHAVTAAVRAIPNTSEHFGAREDYLAVGYAIKAALPDDPDAAFEAFSEWCDRWQDGENDLAVVAADWRRMKPPYRRGARYLFDLAEKLGGFNRGEVFFEPIPDEPVDPEDLPVDVFGDGDVTAALELPRGVLPPRIEAFVFDTAGRIGAPAGYLAGAALATAAGAIGSKVKIQPKQNDTQYTEPPFLAVGLVGDPAARKSPSISAATAPLEAADKRAAEAGMATLRAYEAAERARKKGDPPLGPKPSVRRHVIENATMEAITGVLVANPHGLLVKSDELAEVTSGMNEYKGGKGRDRQSWLQLLDGRGDKRVDRVGSGFTSVETFGASLIGGIQPSVIRSSATGLIGDGLMQRFLVVMGDDVRRKGLDQKPDAEAHAAYKSTITALAKYEPLLPNVVTIGKQARPHWEKLEQRIEDLIDLPGLSEAWLGHLGKWTRFAARLLLVCHLVEHVDDVARIDDIPVDEETALRTIRLCNWFLTHSLRFYTTIIGGGEAGEDARYVAGFMLTKRPEKITRRMLGQQSDSLRDPDRAVRAMRFLEAHNWVIADGQKSDRHGPAAWTVCPAVYDGRFADRAETERRRRETVRERILVAGRARRELTESSHAA